MPLYEMTQDAFRPMQAGSFVSMGVKERGDLQRLLRAQIEVLDENLYVLSEEFGEWEDSRRRIDLLAVDREANLVVIELKRTADGGHMELQAIRYASMVSTMTFERACGIHGEYLARIGEDAVDAEGRLLAFLGWDEASEEAFGQDVKMLLVSEDFSKELTTAVLWLREREIDIRCIRLRPYRDGERLMVDVQQVIPLPEAQEYQVRLREKEKEGRRVRSAKEDLYLRFWSDLLVKIRAAGGRHAEIQPSPAGWIGASSGVSGLHYNYVVGADDARVELYFKRSTAEQNKAAFDAILERKGEIEGRFGDSLGWERLDTKQACRIRYDLSAGGIRSAGEPWQGFQDELVRQMKRFEAAVQPTIEAIGI